MYVSSYKTARSVASFISAFGWLVTAVGVLSLLVAIFGTDAPAVGARLIVFAISGATIVAGQVVVALGQITRAVVDTADNTGRLADTFARIATEDSKPPKSEPDVYTISAAR